MSEQKSLNIKASAGRPVVGGAVAILVWELGKARVVSFANSWINASFQPEEITVIVAIVMMVLGVSLIRYKAIVARQIECRPCLDSLERELTWLRQGAERAIQIDSQSFADPIDSFLGEADARIPAVRTLVERCKLTCFKEPYHSELNDLVLLEGAWFAGGYERVLTDVQVIQERIERSRRRLLLVT